MPPEPGTLEAWLEAQEAREQEARAHSLVSLTDEATGSSTGHAAQKPYEEDAKATAGNTWEALRDLPPLASAVPTLPAEMLPAPLRPWIDDVSERLCVHREYVAIPTLVSLGAVIGRTVGIHPKQHDDWLETPNLWGALIGPPSSKKSPAISEGSAPLDRLAAKAAEDFATSQAEREADAEIIRLEIETVKRQARAKDATPADFKSVLQTKLGELEANGKPERRYFTNDGTIEKLGMLLKENPRGLLVKRDELMGLLRTCDKSSQRKDLLSW